MFLWEKIKILFIACRGYSMPITIVSWFVPFLFSYFDNGNVYFGLLALIGILSLHLGTNIFDDFIDYSRELFEVKQGKKNEINLQKGKCICIINGDLTLKNAFLISIFLFSFASLIGIFFLKLLGLKLLYIVIPTAILCLLYPILGGYYLGEIIVGIIYSPFLYMGVYYVMTGNFSSDILKLSISTGLLVITVLYNHMLLDYKTDFKNRKRTLCNLCKSELNAYKLLVILVVSAYLNIVILTIIGKLSYTYLLTLLSIPYAINLLKNMKKHVVNENSDIEFNPWFFGKRIIKNTPEEKKNFLYKFMLAENLLTAFTIVLCIAIIIDKIK